MTPQRVLIRRYAGVTLLMLAAVAFAIASWIHHRPAAPQAVCQPGMAGAIAVDPPNDIRTNEPNDLPVRIRACRDSLDNAGVLVAELGSGYATDIDVQSTDPYCERSRVGTYALALACGPLDRGQDRQILLRVVPHGGPDLPAGFSAVSMGFGPSGQRTTVLDTAAVRLSTTSSWGGIPQWVIYPWMLVALIAGVDMARRGRSGVAWAIGVFVFSGFGLVAWLVRRTEWAIVPEGSPPQRRPLTRTGGRWLHATEAAASLAILGLVVGGAILASRPSVSSSIPHAIAIPQMATPALQPLCLPTTDVPDVAATRIIDQCGGADSATATVPMGATIAITRDVPGQRMRFDLSGSELGDGSLVPTGIRTDSSLVVLARAPGRSFVSSSALCLAACPPSPVRTTTLTVTP